MRLFGLLLVFAACHTEGSLMTPDAPVDTPDAPPRSAGMSVSWNAKPALPGPVTNNITATEVTFQIEHLQLVSDAGAPTHSRYQLLWSQDSTPEDDVFPDAPVGTYQRIVLDMRPGIDVPFAYQILGTWRDKNNNNNNNGSPKPFRIIDTMTLMPQLACNVALPAGGGAALTIQVDLQDVLDGVDFGSIMPDPGGVIVVDRGKQLMNLRMRLLSAFTIDTK